MAKNGDEVLSASEIAVASPVHCVHLYPFDFPRPTQYHEPLPLESAGASIPMNALTSQAVYEQLLKKISSGEYPPGMRLADQALADEMEVGAPAIHDAVRKLTEDGLVEQITGQGAFVREFSAKDLIRLYAFREQMEVLAAREAADTIQTHQKKELLALCDAFDSLASRLAEVDAAAPDRKLIHEWHTQDAAFHEAIIEASGNEWLQHAVSATRMVAHVTRCKPRDKMPQDPTATAREHREIAKAIADGDAYMAGEHMLAHVQRAMNGQLALMDSRA